MYVQGNNYKKQGGRMKRKHNRHGFQNYGGGHTGSVGHIEPANIDQLTWIENVFSTKKELAVPVFDAWFSPIGNVIRYDLRKKGLINEEAVSGQDFKRIVLTKKALAILKNAKTAKPAVKE